MSPKETKKLLKLLNIQPPDKDEVYLLLLFAVMAIACIVVNWAGLGR